MAREFWSPRALGATRVSPPRRVIEMVSDLIPFICECGSDYPDGKEAVEAEPSGPCRSGRHLACDALGL